MDSTIGEVVPGHLQLAKGLLNELNHLLDYLLFASQLYLSSFRPTPPLVLGDERGDIVLGPHCKL